MRWWPWVSAFAAASAATLIYGAVHAANQLVVERRTLRLPRWPADKNGYRIALIADLHVRDRYSAALCRRAAEAMIEEEPDMFIIAGDFVNNYRLNFAWLLEEALGPLRNFKGRVLGVPGNHDYWEGDPRVLGPVLEELGIKLLRNETYHCDDIAWVGVDSAIALAADPFSLMAELKPDETGVVLWHEPDFVEMLPVGAALMLAGHSHAGQFRFPWGWTPMNTMFGEKYVEGFYPEAPTPLYVTRGIGTTGPPSRLGVLPEVAILTLKNDES
ncbi:MAG TPA: metallophosphoesterase [Fimbriimonadaceae bacterium]